MKIRVYELAKELNMNSKELIEKIKEIGFDVASHMSTLEENEAETIRKNLKNSKVEKTEGKKSVERGNKKPPMKINHNKKSGEKTEKKSAEASKVEEEPVYNKNTFFKNTDQKSRYRNKDKFIINKNVSKSKKEIEKPIPGKKEGAKLEEVRKEEAKKVEIKAETPKKPVDKKEEVKKEGQKKPDFKKQEFMKTESKKQSEDKKPDSKKFEAKREDKSNFKRDNKKFTSREEKEDLDLIPEGKPDVNKHQKHKIKKEIDEARDFHKGDKKKDKRDISELDKDNKGKSKDKKAKDEKSAQTKPEPKKADKDEIKIIEIEAPIVVKDFAEKLGVSPSKVIQKLIVLGVMVSQNQTIDFDVAQLVGEEFDAIVEEKVEEVIEETTIEEEFSLDFEDPEESLKPRWPIVTVMGHVDHGKTSLLDAIKKSHVTKSEAGGITQHIGAYLVPVGDKKICFLDTPGHEAFTQMRARGAQVTDIAILVVAADDGVMPQTIEAINHAKAANVPIVVAINKIDKDTANVDRIKQELVENNVVPEDWGGDVITVPVSAKKEIGISDLLEMVLLVAEMQDLKANYDRTIVGTVVEAKLDKHRGTMATVLISKGTLNTGDSVVSGTAFGKVRQMLDDKGKVIKKAGPSTPVVIMGLSEVPNAGDLIYSTKDDKTAKAAAQLLVDRDKVESMKAGRKVSLDDLFDRIKLGEIKDLNIIIKADVRGSIEALKQSLLKLGTDEVQTRVIHEGVGGISENDVMLASASNAIIVGFNVRPNQNAIDVAKSEEVDIRTYRVIYEAIEDIKSAIIGMHTPKFVEEIIGRAEIRDVFGLPTGNKVAGIYVQSGHILRRAQVRLIRDDVVITENKIASLRRFKDDVRELQSGYEGGLMIENYNDIKVGDTLEIFMDKEVEMKDLNVEGKNE